MMRQEIRHRRLYAFCNGKVLNALLMAIMVCLLPTACADHDDPQLAPIDTSQMKISANVAVNPTAHWLNQTEEVSISVSDIEMTAPKGVVIRSIALYKDNGPVMEKPYSGEPLDFKYLLQYSRGRVYFSIIANLIKQNARDAQILIKDNIQCVVFSETPQFECEANVDITVKSKSTSGEEYSKTFEVKSTDHFTIPLSAAELYWAPASGTASTLEVTLTGDAKTWSTNSTLESRISKIYWDKPSAFPGHEGSSRQEITLTLPNTPGALGTKNLGLVVTTVEYGTWENVTVEPSNMTYGFVLTETD